MSPSSIVLLLLVLILNNPLLAAAEQLSLAAAPDPSHRLSRCWTDKMQRSNLALSFVQAQRNVSVNGVGTNFCFELSSRRRCSAGRCCSSALGDDVCASVLTIEMQIATRCRPLDMAFSFDSGAKLPAVAMPAAAGSTRVVVQVDAPLPRSSASSFCVFVPDGSACTSLAQLCGGFRASSSCKFTATIRQAPAGAAKLATCCALTTATTTADPCAGVTCAPPQAQCLQAAVCRAGSCGPPLPVPDGTPCQDGSHCTWGDTCERGVCVSGIVVECAAPPPCHRAECNPDSAGCLYIREENCTSDFP